MNATFGQYVDYDSFFHKLHPLTKLYSLFMLITVTLLYANIYFYVGQLIMLCLLLVLGKLPLRIIGKSLWSIRFLFIFLFVFNVIFIREGTPIWQWGILAVYPKTFLVTGNLVLRLLLLTSYATILTMTTKPLDLTNALEKELSFFGNGAHILAMILSIALRFIPTLQGEAYKIMKAQSSRGASFTDGNIFKRMHHLVTLLIPLFVISFSRADTLAVAMELRGYDPNAPRSKYRILTWKRVDTIVLSCVAIYTVLAIIMKCI